MSFNLEFINITTHLVSPAERLSRDFLRVELVEERDRGDRDRERDLRPLGDDSRSLFRLKSSNLQKKSTMMQFT